MDLSELARDPNPFGDGNPELYAIRCATCGYVVPPEGTWVSVQDRCICGDCFCTYRDEIGRLLANRRELTAADTERCDRAWSALRLRLDEVQAARGYGHKRIKLQDPGAAFGLFGTCTSEDHGDRIRHRGNGRRWSPLTYEEALWAYYKRPGDGVGTCPHCGKPLAEGSGMSETSLRFRYDDGTTEGGRVVVPPAFQETAPVDDGPLGASEWGYHADPVNEPAKDKPGGGETSLRFRWDDGRR